MVTQGGTIDAKAATDGTIDAAAYPSVLQMERSAIPISLSVANNSLGTNEYGLSGTEGFTDDVDRRQMMGRDKDHFIQNQMRNNTNTPDDLTPKS